MKIISVACSNLNSLRGKQPHRLDFEAAPLEGCGLFAISGPTGAGKSTLLDAITLALYGRTPRQKNGQALCSHGSTESWAEVVYEVGNSRYFSRWSIRQAKKLGGAPKVAIEVCPWPQQEGDWQTQKITESVEKNVALTGMNYDQFTRSVLLAQGAFAQFLTAKEDERADLLERMTGTAIYKELSRSTHARHRSEADKLAHLLEQQKAFQVLSTEELQVKTEQFQQTAEAVLSAKTTVESWLQQLTWHQEVAGGKEKVDKAENELALAVRHRSSHETILSRLATHESVEPFAATWRDLKRAKAEVIAIERKHQGLQEEVVATGLQLETSAAKVQQVKEVWEQALDKLTSIKPALTAALAQVPKLETLARHLQQAIVEWKAKQQELQTISAKEHALNSQTTANREELTELEPWLQLHKGDAKLESTIANLQHWLTLRAKSVTEHSAQRKERQVIESNLRQAIQEQGNHQKNEEVAALALTELRNQLKQWQGQQAGQINAATQRQQDLNQTLDVTKRTAEDCYAQLLGKELFRNHAAQLQQGVECPLCGALEHPVRGRMMDTSDEAISALRSRYTNLDSEITLLDSELKQNEALLVHLKSVPPLLVSAEPAVLLTVKDALRAAQHLLADLHSAPAQKVALERDYKQAIEGVAAAVEKESTVKEQLTKLDSQLASIEQEGKAATAQIEGLANDLGSHFDRKSPNLLLEELTTRSTLFQQKQRRYTELTPLLAAANATLHAYQIQIARLKEECQQAEVSVTQLNADKSACAAAIAAAHPGFDTPQAALTHWENEVASSLSLYESTQNAERIIRGEYEKLQERTRALVEQSDQGIALTSGLDVALRQQLLEAGLSGDPAQLDEILLLDAERDALRQVRQQIESALSSAQAYAARCRQELNTSEQKALSMETPSVVHLNWETAHEVHQGLIKQHTLLEKEILDEQQRQQQFAVLQGALSAQQAETLRWSSLQELIGSSDGTKFSRFAQGLTLARLVGLANEHLRQFNDRYQLRRKDTTSLFLLVADSYDDCTREVSTLSGGETFLVSLALALGLSELASNSARIDSLFIDEGFGTLDEETLQIALGALSNLRNRGKTIGIITHVDAEKLEGYIDTRVLVERVSQGSSCLRLWPDVLHPVTV